MTIIPGRMTDAHSGPLVVFLIGMRINHFHKITRWWPVMRAMGPMLRELAANPQSGFLGSEVALCSLRQIILIQYWRDFDSLEHYARDRDALHWPAWTAFNRAIGSDGSVGIYHETYCVAAEAHETVYANMPPFGLARFAGSLPATGSRNKARSRMRAAQEPVA
ncbi:MAG: transcriptional regulator [Erythrobacter sp.]|nr:MAG: transcriptional regulator [Erythrobacter sp.]